MHPWLIAVSRLVKEFIVLGIISLVYVPSLTAQQVSDKGSTLDRATLQLLLAKIDQLEARVSQLESDRPKACGYKTASVLVPANPASSGVLSTTAAPIPAPQVSAVPPTVSPSSSDQEPAQSENAMNDRMDLSKTLLRIRGFGDTSLHGDTKKGDTTSFSLGQLDLFVTSDVSEKFSFLSEIVFEAGPDNIYGNQEGAVNTFGVDIERYLLQYSANDYFNLSVGRGHTAIGYYNNAYHHSTWLQTSTDRPFLFEFEDRGGILPVHTVGASAKGAVPSGRLGLHYIAEIGNGRASRTPLDQEPVQNVLDDQNHKAFNLAFFARPEALRGFQAGFSLYHDLLAPAHEPKIGETIASAHAVLIRPKFEWLNEALLDRHAPVTGSKVFNTPGFYSQISRQLGAYRPYFRYEYLNASNNEPIFPDVRLRHGPVMGLRYDASESVALKFQYNYTFMRDQPGVTALTTQVGFTF